MFEALEHNRVVWRGKIEFYNFEIDFVFHLFQIIQDIFTKNV